MYFSEFKIRSYKSYWETESIPLSLGVNLLVGKNNAGKTAFLEAMQVSASNMPHRSLRSVPSHGDKPSKPSSFEFVISCRQEELRQHLSNQPFWVHQQRGDEDNPVLHFWRWIHEQERIKFCFEGRSGIQRFLRTEPQVPFGLALMLEANSKAAMARYSYDRDKSEISLHDRSSVASKHHFAFRLGMQHLGRVYRFDSVRDVKGVCDVNVSTELQPNGANLAACVQDLQSEGYRRVKHYNELVRRVFPSIREVTAARDGGRVRIEIWKFDGRRDLTFALDECGSGVAQVLCILYILVTSRFPRTILIDEPNSFLHPTAARALMEIIAEYGDQHQFVVSTHSPLIVSSARSSSIILTEIDNGVSELRTIEPDQRDQITKALMALGSRLSDVFGVDRIVWVEGETEQECFPMILEALTDVKLAGTAIRAVKHTGDFDGKDAENTFDIYENLSSSHSLLPTAAAYVFDLEDKSSRKVEDLKRKGSKVGADVERIRFLDARMYENFLLVPEAIKYAIEQDPYANDVSVELETVETELKNELDRRYREHCPDASSQEWEHNETWLLESVHAAEVIDHVFDFVSESTLELRKTLHSPLMTEWLLANEPEKLRPIANLLEEVLARSVGEDGRELPN
ncbi:hypothetical protein FIV42_10520 [Persicimonas caeni]|uniref:ATPase AAA-type core domain-containing protein n=1 Tax=Persicimonas caeni TaxID=2292766 RepID=A0A4Y6PS32_PERCE|nr:AAA family ATPase [Persicimonas caeni]QDG51154.1 hypothetical protein FIV42_10520 [Persicimonas caeni]QED32375.1 AAA family ATPase [Persicimonas caeni]